MMMASTANTALPFVRELLVLNPNRNPIASSELRI
jgi:hypothetical protein